MRRCGYSAGVLLHSRLFLLLAPLLAAAPHSLRAQDSAAAPIVHLKASGARGDGQADDSAAIQRWADQCMATKALCFADSGRYRLTTTIHLDRSIRIMGANAWTTTFVLATPAMTGLAITADNPVYIEHLGFAAASPQDAGEALLVDAAAGSYNSSSHFNALMFNGLWTAVHFNRAAFWTLENSRFYGGSGPQVIIDNITNPDLGDNNFTGNSCIYNKNRDAPQETCIIWLGSGGTRIANNKFLQGYQHIALSPKGRTGSLLIQGNSFENFYKTGISFKNERGTGYLSKINIASNEFLGFSNAAAIQSDAEDQYWLKNITINGNTVVLNSDKTGTAFNAISLHRVDTAAISGNNIDCTQAGTLNSTGIDMDASNRDISISGNNISGCHTTTRDLSLDSPAAWADFTPICQDAQDARKMYPAKGRYRLAGKTAYLTTEITIAPNRPATKTITCSLPAESAGALHQMLTGMMINGNGDLLIGQIEINKIYISSTKDGFNTTSETRKAVVSGTYETQ